VINRSGNLEYSLDLELKCNVMMKIHFLDPFIMEVEFEFLSLKHLYKQYTWRESLKDKPPLFFYSSLYNTDSLN